MPTWENAHALVVGIAAYRYVDPLPAVYDAQGVYELLVDPAYCGYSPDCVTLLVDGQATQAALRRELADLAQRTNEDSTVLVYFSGHGARIPVGPCAGDYLVPVDARFDSDETLAETPIAGGELTDAFRAIAARKLVVIFDCCHAGGIGEPKSLRSSILPGLSERLFDVLKAGRGRVMLASSRQSEFSWVQPGAKYGVFTEHLLNGLHGEAPGPGGVVRIFDLFNHVQTHVVAAQPNQHPVFKAEFEENFAVALYQGGKIPHIPAATPDDEFRYDVFISYRQQEPDKSWVRKTLLPRLEAQGVRVCIDYRDFRLGALLLHEMERAVATSRYTLAVLSPLYLTSTFTDLENVMADHLGLEEGERRLVAVMLADCKPRLGMRARLWLDMTDGDEFEINLARLVFELRQTETLG